MSRQAAVVVVSLACVILAGCNAVAAVAGISGPKIVSVTVNAPAGLLVGDSAVATAVAMGDDGKDHVGRPRTWSSSDPAALPIDANGKMVALIGGRTVTITADVDGTKGSAIVVIASDDTRFGYALADQPTAAGPYAPDAAYRYNSSGGTITVTRSDVGVYSVRFGGLGRRPGERDNVQVSGYGTAGVYCKPQVWDASGADLIVPVGCFLPDGTPTDGKFTILVLGARVFGASTPLGFALPLGDTGTYFLDTAATARNSTGGHVGVARTSQGVFSIGFTGLGLASGGASGPVGFLVTPVGQGVRRCRVHAYDLTAGGLQVVCTGAGEGLQDAAFSVLWVTKGRSGLRYGFAWAHNATATSPYVILPEVSRNSSGGSVTSRQTAVGQYRVVFAGLARPAGATEIVMVSAFGGNLATERAICTIGSWGNSGANDLAVTVSCVDRAGTALNSRFDILVLE
jgi:hypothetical protein